MAHRPKRLAPGMVVQAIGSSGLSIYDPLDSCPELYLDTESLEHVLRRGLLGLRLDYPIRTRSKVLKAKVCEVLGYPVPGSFRRTQPRFPGQNFDTYVQKANNLQIWNQQVAPSRRYVLVRVGADHVVTGVRVVTGDVIAGLDKTGTLTHKYQAKSRKPVSTSFLISDQDTENVLRRLIGPGTAHLAPTVSPGAILRPTLADFFPISSLYERLLPLVGSVLPNPGIDQERNRGAALHQAARAKIGLGSSADSGQFPDVSAQLLELKLQTAPTIDLGLVSPDNNDPLANLPDFRHCDVRYAVFYGTVIPAGVRLDALVLTTGEDFFSFFQRFEGRVRNTKLQIPLPRAFFDQAK